MSIDQDGATAEQTAAGDGGARRRRLRVLLLVLGLLVVGYVVLAALAGDRVPRGTTVEGVAIGGLTPAAAETRLRSALEERSRTPIVVSVDGSRRTIAPSAAGLAVDYPGSVAAAGGGRSVLPDRLWKHYFGAPEIDAVLEVDDSAMDSAVASLVEDFTDPAVDGGVVFDDGTATPVPPRAGQSVDATATRDALEDQFLDDGTLTLERTEDQPAVDEDAVDEAMRTFATPAMSGPVTLVLEGEEVVVRPRLFGRALSMEPEGDELVPAVDAKKLSGLLSRRSPAFGEEPVDATFRIVSGKPRLVPARNAVRFDLADLEEKFAQVLVQPEGQRTVAVSASVAKPELTTAKARALGIKEQVSTFTTYFPYAEYRNINLSRAAELINGTLLEPGETFSLNGIVGERTEENGFTEGFIIKDGLFRLELGGGVSQIATTTFNAMYFAGLEDVQHKAHSVYISRYPEGREATVAWPSVDLRFRNTTPHGIFITAGVQRASPGGQGAATVSMYSTKYWDISSRKGARYAFTEPPTRYLDADDCEPSDGGPGFSVDVFRTFRRAGSSEVVRTEKFHTVYNPEPHLICGKKPPE